MRKLILSLCGLASVCVASAQISVGAFTNYTMYKGDFGRNTAGFGVRGVYAADRYMAALSFTNGLPITENSTTYVTNNGNGSQQAVASQARVSFKTISLSGNRVLVGDEESAGKFYLGFGASFVIASYSEKITGSYDKNTYTAPEMESGSENGFVLNGLAGGEYKIGMPTVFAEAGIALPANQVNGQYTVNYIPAHFMFNLGVKFKLGGE